MAKNDNVILRGYLNLTIKEREVWGMMPEDYFANYFSQIFEELEFVMWNLLI
jgi:hypothetical protein